MDNEVSKQEKLIPIAQKSFSSYEEMYRIVDFLNKTLKEKYNIMFGLTKNNEDDFMTITIYEF
ncbi:YpmA family protein [Desulfotruncus alcoholivorax]|uniref:YpmA family protein n=1 Tax=Desulfotruncus alcoholivorax TaxID=265477 RepID=UPI0003FD9D6F|nr:YpmA family protein [Desulfotruncus alcoholivorax]